MCDKPSMHLYNCFQLITILFQEWDGLLRIAFIRKNKTLHSVFRNKQVTERVKRNYLKICDAKNTPVIKARFFQKTISNNLARV